MNAIKQKWCDVTDWWQYHLYAKQRRTVVALAIVAALAILLATHWL